ncbi:hypothetical protein EUGRSUZ_L00763 [Eucalyptus grandis]|uniref:ABC transporter domain-containing protein n=3 Tax=Eucalyptus grandis TaxID=71139 RepID=A0AAD9WJ51_EUCGR|nr:hypothetical protein EUGRSUZ_L00763 [Eucalyptus grandis]
MDTASGLGSRKAETLVDPECDCHGAVLGPLVLDSMHVGPKSNRRAIWLTWPDVWVTVGDHEDGCVPILQGLTGFAQPGEVLAIMGPSGCGKSTLLDALAGRLDSKRRLSGQILVNGRKEPLAYGTSAYVTQDDVLTSTLTVKEAVYFSAQLQLPDTMAPSEKKQRAEATIKEMGLHDAAGTRIGGWGNKGLSNGQRRRVSICMEILTRPKLLFLDEPTSGLDSAASYYVMRRIVGLAKQHYHFLYFTTTLFACMMLVESLMMIVASVVPSFLMGLTVGSGIQGLMILGGGFFRLPHDLPKVFWRDPLYYLSFNKYAFHGLFKNEFEGLTFPKDLACSAQNGSISGEDVLKDIWQVEMRYTKWTDLAILFEMALVYRLIFFGVLKTTETLKPIVKEIMSARRRQKGQDSVNPSRASLPESEGNNSVAQGWCL